MTKFAVKAAIDGDDRLARMRENMARAIPRFEPQPVRDGVLAVVGYGPSLRDTWREIKTPLVCTTSGAHDFLISRKIIPTWHVEFDPRPHKADFLKHPCHQTTYCIASVCNANLFAALASHKVLLWHAGKGDMADDCDLVNEYEADGIVFSGGSNAGLRALALGHALGFRKFELFGMDCSYREGETWAGPHSSKRHPSFKVICNGKEFLTSDVMLNSADELFSFVLAGLKSSKTTIHGEHLFAERIRLLGEQGLEVAGGHRWWQPGEGFVPRVIIDGVEQVDRLISDDYKATLRWLHEIDPSYGTGSSHAKQVAMLMRVIASDDVLDYGCGKGALAKKLGKTFKHYDPGIDDAPPVAADLVVCANVLEEVEDVSLNAVVKHVASLTKRLAYFAINTRKDGEWIAERTVAHGAMDFRWWSEVLEQHFDFVAPPFGDKTHLRALCVPKGG